MYQDKENVKFKKSSWWWYYLDDVPGEQTSAGGVESITSENQSKLKSKVCKFFNTKFGCKNKQNCTFQHVKQKYCWWETNAKCLFGYLCWNRHRNKGSRTETKSQSNKKRKKKLDLGVELKMLKIKIKHLKRTIDDIKEKKLSRPKTPPKTPKKSGRTEANILEKTPKEIIPGKKENKSDYKNATLPTSIQETEKDEVSKGTKKEAKESSVKIKRQKVNSKTDFWTGLRLSYGSKIKQKI